MSGKTTKLLLVEDNPGDARLLRELLLEAGASYFDLTHVERLDEAFKQLAAESFDVVLLDLLLPDSLGSETLLRLHAHSPQTPIVVLTGVEDESLGAQLVQDGAQDYLVKGKPGGESLARVIRYAIERKRAEETLRESEERFRTVAQSANEAIVVADDSGTIVTWNKGAEKIFLYSSQEALGQPVSILMPEPYRSQHREAVKRIHDGAAPRIIGKMYESCGLRKDGSEVPVEISLASWETAQHQYYSAMIRDITERKRAEEEILRNAARTEALLHIAARLNAELDLQAVLNAVCEETARALNVPAAVVSLYDEKSDLLSIRADFGLPCEFRERHIPMSRANYEEFTRVLGPVNTIPDAQAMPGLPNAALCVALDIRTIAGASMILHEEELVGALSIYTLKEVRHFTADELPLCHNV